MQKLKQLTVLCLVAVLFFSCDKVKDLLGSEEGRALANLRLEKFTRDGRTYTFHYHRNGRVDSVTASGDNSYTYRVSYNGQKIDSSSLWQNGQLISSKKDVTYDLAGRITGYTYQLHVYPQPPRDILLSYNAQGDVHLIENASGNDTLYYNTDHGLADRYNSFNHYQYTNHSSLNPLNYTAYLVIFTEENFTELWLSKRNAIQEVINGSSHQTTTFTNEFDAQGRITKRTATGYSSGLMTFTYL